MVRTKHRQRRLSPKSRPGGLSAEHKEFVLSCHVCQMSYGEFAASFAEQFGRRPPAQKTYSDYAQRWSEEIGQRRSEWRKNLRLAGLPFVEAFERVARYGRFAKIEIKRHRFKEAREHMEAIAKETGDLKHAMDVKVNIGFDNRSTGELTEFIAAALQRTGALPAEE